MLLSASIVKCFMFIVLCRLSFAVVTIHHSGQEEQQGKSSKIIRGFDEARKVTQMAGSVPFLASSEESVGHLYGRIGTRKLGPRIRCRMVRASALFPSQLPFEPVLSLHGKRYAVKRERSPATGLRGKRSRRKVVWRAESGPSLSQTWPDDSFRVARNT